jgi:peptidoglycan/xylan/chitin deacetylase (PgdA/CDA1 family)
MRVAASARSLPVALALALLLLGSGALRPSPASACDFALGFKALHDAIPDRVGACLDDERHDPANGDAVQHAAGGLLVWRKADNLTAFTDGARTWIDGPYGLQSRANGDCLWWELCPGRPAPTVAVSADEVVHGDPSRPWISVIFNAGAGYAPAPAILDALKARGVRTTFFLMGWWSEQNPDLVRRIAADGHEIASHGDKTFDLTTVSDGEVIADLERADAKISQIIGRSTRPLWSASASARDGRVNRLAASIGYRPFFWCVESGDWRTDSTADGVARRVLAGVQNGSIVVMHFESPRTADTVAPALPALLDALQARGYRLVTISELVSGRQRGG